MYYSYSFRLTGKVLADVRITCGWRFMYMLIYTSPLLYSHKSIYIQYKYQDILACEEDCAVGDGVIFDDTDQSEGEKRNVHNAKQCNQRPGLRVKASHHTRRIRWVATPRRGHDNSKLQKTTSCMQYLFGKLKSRL